MADDYSFEDKAELMAESLGIKPSSYTGRVADAVVAMTLIRGFRLLPPNDKRDILRVISEQMQFGQTNPAFVEQCRGAVALIVANPTWVAGSLSNDELEDEITFWRDARWALGFLGIKSVGSIVTGKAQSLLKEEGELIEKAAPGSGISAFKGPVMKALKPSVLSGPVLFGAAAMSVTTASPNDLEAEAKRRGQLGTMSKLHSERYGG